LWVLFAPNFRALTCVFRFQFLRALFVPNNTATTSTSRWRHRHPRTSTSLLTPPSSISLQVVCFDTA
jgi:hypothetical protein